MIVSRRVMVGLVPATALLGLASGDGGAQDPPEIGATAGGLTRASAGRTRLEAADSARGAAGRNSRMASAS